MTTATFNFPCKLAYQVSSQWNTIIDETFSAKEQRRNQWTNSRKSWSLEFDKNNTDTNAVLAFFDARKGSYEAFNWVWPTSLGGDGATYLVRFDKDTLDLSMLEYGYSTFNIKLVQVFN